MFSACAINLMYWPSLIDTIMDLSNDVDTIASLILFCTSTHLGQNYSCAINTFTKMNISNYLSRRCNSCFNSHAGKFQCNGGARRNTMFIVFSLEGWCALSKNNEKAKETFDPVIQYLKNSELWFFYPRLSSSLLMLLMFVINSLVGSLDIMVLKAYRQQAERARERDYLSWNSAKRFAKTVHTDANFKTYSWTCDDLWGMQK